MSTERNPRCRTGEHRSYRWVALLTIIAMFSVAGVALAAGTNQKLLPRNHDPRNAKVGVLTAEPGAMQAPTPGGHSGGGPLAAPSNDDCTGAIAVPPAGPFPYVTTPVDVTDATPQGAPDPTLCPANGVDYTIWYSFTPAVSAQYVFSTCRATATGETVYDTVIGITADCPGSVSLGCNDTGACSAAGPAGAPYYDPGTQAAVLTAGTTYFIGIGHFSGDTGGISPGFNNLQMSVDISPAPANDTCSNPTPLPLDRIVAGTTASATNDYRTTNPGGSGANAACFSGVGQLPTTSNGVDVVFSFTPPDSDTYSFRYVMDDSGAALRGQSPVLYLASNCPAPDPSGVNPPNCIAAANRMNDQTTGNGNRGEEIKCVPLTAGTTVYLFFDDRFTGNPGGPLAVEVTRCRQEAEPNDTPASATPYAPDPASCFMEGSAVPSGQAGDIDFYDLGNPPAGAKIYAALDSAASNNSDYELRITTATDTLGYDDNDGSSTIGSNSPIVSGPIAPGGEIYARVDSKPALGGNEPYRLYAHVETAPAQQEDPETQPGGATTLFYRYVNATKVLGGGHVAGTMSTLSDEDCFQFLAHEGDNIVIFSDNNPGRIPGTITNVWPVMQLINTNPPPANSRFVGQVVRNDMTPSPGTLTGVTPSAVSEFEQYRARYSGAYTFCFTPTQDVNNTDNPSAASYPLPWAGDISLNCGPIPLPGPADLSITKTGPVGPVHAGDIVDYTITVTNNDPVNIAWDPEYVDNLPAGLAYVGLSVNDGFGGGRNAWAASLPTPGTADAPIDVINISIAPGASVVYTLEVQVQNCIAAGTSITNTATVSSYTLDANPANNTSSWTFSTISTADNSCTPLLCDTSGCIADNCQVGPHCDAGACVSTPRDCDDHSVCTADSCDPTNAQHPCVNDDSQLGALCFDGNDCTRDTCDPVLFCQFPPTAAGSACNDFLNCTTNDACNGQGTCVGHNVCDDGQPCTDDFADEANNCACDNPVSFQGTTCSTDACNVNGQCDGTGGSAADCQGTSPANCDDGNPCTDDSCNPASGCVHTPNTASCNDGNACTTNDTCSGGTCQGTALNCNDGNVCNGTETCNPATGCVAGTPLICDDGNACNGTETCNPATGCVAGQPLNCNDNNPCTDDSCNPASGCVHANNTASCSDGNACTLGDVCSGGSCQPGAPKVCTASDSCHIAGVCQPATGLCTSPAKPDGAACDDGSLCTTGDSCQGGICTGTSHINDEHPRTVGYYKDLCKHSHSGDQLTTADAQCVSDTTCTFDNLTVASMCAILGQHVGGDDDHDDHTGTGDPGHVTYCDKARAELVALALNRCRARVCDAQQVQSDCDDDHDPTTGPQTVGQSFQLVDGTLCSNPGDPNICKGARCYAQEINEGKALKIHDMHADRVGANGMHMTWSIPMYNDGTTAPSAYQIYRRPHGTGDWTLVDTVHVNEWNVTDPNNNFDYDVIPVE